MRVRPITFALVLSVACGSDNDGGDPLDVRFGDTALVVVLNPVINDANGEQLPEPGPIVEGISIASDDGVAAVTASDGVAVLGPLEPGDRTITVDDGDGLLASFDVTISAGELLEIAVAADGDQAAVMLEIDYKTDQVVELNPDMSPTEVDQALSVGDSVVFVSGGTYAGDLDFSGSRVTLFGEGLLGGGVILDGTITMSGSDSRIRGTQITGDLIIEASGAGLSFSRVDGDLAVDGSDATLLANFICGETASFDGSDPIVVGNVGTSPAPNCP